MKRLVWLATLCSSTALAQPQPETPPPAQDETKLVGIGYKAGNGIGFLGADVIVNALPHLSLDLHAAVMPVTASDGESSTVYMAAPAIQGHLYDGQRNTPYGAIGLQYGYLALGSATATAVGAFANVGYQWQWKSGLGILLGGGVQYLGRAQATNGSTMITIGGGAAPNIEFSVRYMFL